MKLTLVEKIDLNEFLIRNAAITRASHADILEKLKKCIEASGYAADLLSSNDGVEILPQNDYLLNLTITFNMNEHTANIKFYRGLKEQENLDIVLQERNRELNFGGDNSNKVIQKIKQYIPSLQLLKDKKAITEANIFDKIKNKVSKIITDHSIKSDITAILNSLINNLENEFSNLRFDIKNKKTDKAEIYITGRKVKFAYKVIFHVDNSMLSLPARVADYNNLEPVYVKGDKKDTTKNLITLFEQIGNILGQNPIKLTNEVIEYFKNDSEKAAEKDIEQRAETDKAEKRKSIIDTLPQDVRDQAKLIKDDNLFNSLSNIFTKIESLNTIKNTTVLNEQILHEDTFNINYPQLKAAILNASDEDIKTLVKIYLSKNNTTDYMKYIENEPDLLNLIVKIFKETKELDPEKNILLGIILYHNSPFKKDNNSIYKLNYRCLKILWDLYESNPKNIDKLIKAVREDPEGKTFWFISDKNNKDTAGSETAVKKIKALLGDSTASRATLSLDSEDLSNENFTQSDLYRALENQLKTGDFKGLDDLMKDIKNNYNSKYADINNKVQKSIKTLFQEIIDELKNNN